MRLLSIAMLIALAGLPPASHGRNHDPVATAQGFLVAVRRNDCERAWAYFSAAAQAYIENRSREMVRRAPYYADVFAPRNLYCRPTSVHRFHSYQPRTARLKSRSGRRAVVGLDRHDAAGFRLPGFFPSTVDVVPVEMHLVEEAGAWKIVVP